MQNVPKNLFCVLCVSVLASVANAQISPNLPNRTVAPNPLTTKRCPFFAAICKTRS